MRPEDILHLADLFSMDWQDFVLHMDNHVAVHKLALNQHCIQHMSGARMTGVLVRLLRNLKTLYAVEGPKLGTNG